MGVPSHTALLRAAGRVGLLPVVVVLLGGVLPLAGETAPVVLPPLLPDVIDLAAPVSLHVHGVMAWEAFAMLERQLGSIDGGRRIRLLASDPGWTIARIREDLPAEPLHAALDRVCTDAQLRWCTAAGVVLVDHPLAASALQALIAQAHPRALPPPEDQLAAAGRAANALVRCGDRDGILALLAALGDPALDHVAPADRGRALAYQQGLIDALGAQAPTTTLFYRWDTSPALRVLAPQAVPAIARAWARAGRGELAFTPLLCYLCGAAQLTQALPVLRQLAADPAAVVRDLDPHGLRQGIALALIRATAIWSLGALHDRPSVPLLGRLLGQSPPPPVLEMTLTALGMLGDGTAADAILALPASRDKSVQRAGYVALATLRPEALPRLAVSLAGGSSAPPLLPTRWWVAVAEDPVAAVVPLAFGGHDLQGVQDPNDVLAAWTALAGLPGMRARVEAAARDQLAHATDPHLRTLDRMLLAMQGDAALHAQLFSEALSAPVIADAWRPWDQPLKFLGPLSAAEEDRLLTAPPTLLSRWDAFAALADRRDQVEAILVRSTAHPVTPEAIAITRMLADAGEPATRARLVQALTPPPTGDARACLQAFAQLPDWGLADPVLTQAVLALLQDPRPAVAGRAAVYLASDDADDRVLEPLLAWAARQRLQDIPASLVRAPDAPWNVPGPLRHPLRLPYAVYAQEAEQMLQWALTSTDASTQRTLIWWLGIHTQETQRPYRVAVIQGLQRLADATDAGVAQAARQQLRAFVAFGADQPEVSVRAGLLGDADDRAALVALDGLVAPVQALLAAPVRPHPAAGGF